MRRPGRALYHEALRFSGPGLPAPGVVDRAHAAPSHRAPDYTIIPGSWWGRVPQEGLQFFAADHFFLLQARGDGLQRRPLHLEN